MQKTIMESIPISSRARALWAKAGGAEERNLWSLLYVHMADSAGVARKLWHEWLAESVKHQIANAFGCDDSATAALVTWLAGIHDIGKATPGFQYKVSERAELVEQAGLQVPSPRMMSHPPSHAFMSEAILEDWLDGRGWGCSWTFGCILGAHRCRMGFAGVAPGVAGDAGKGRGARAVSSPLYWSSWGYELATSAGTGDAGGIRHGRRRATHYRSVHGQRQNRGRTDELGGYGIEKRGRGNRLSFADNGNFQRDVQTR